MPIPQARELTVESVSWPRQPAQCLQLGKLGAHSKWRLSARFKPANFDLDMSDEGSTAAVGRVQFYARTRPTGVYPVSKERPVKCEEAVVQLDVAYLPQCEQAPAYQLHVQNAARRLGHNTATDPCRIGRRTPRQAVGWRREPVPGGQRNRKRLTLIDS